MAESEKKKETSLNGSALGRKINQISADRFSILHLTDGLWEESEKDKDELAVKVLQTLYVKTKRKPL